MAHGFMYLVVIMDCVQPVCIGVEVIQTTLDADFCVEALEEALKKEDRMFLI